MQSPTPVDDAGLLANFVIGPDVDHLGVGVVARLPAEKWAESLAILTGNAEKMSGPGAVIYSNASARVAVVLPRGEAKTTGPFFDRWVWLLGLTCHYAAQVPTLTADIATEKASRTPDLDKLRDLRRWLRFAKKAARAEEYRTWTTRPFPFGLLDDAARGALR